MKQKSLMSDHQLRNQIKREHKNVKRQGFININYSDQTFKYRGSTYKILSRRSKYPYTVCKIGKKVMFTNHKTGRTYYKWIKLTGSFVIPCGYSVGTSRTLKIPNGQWREGYKPTCQASFNHTHLKDFIKDGDFTGKKDKDIVFCEQARLLSLKLGEPPKTTTK